MARTLPDRWDHPSLASAAPSEVATLRLLASGLPDDCTVYHGVHWTRVEHGYSVYGEIDFIVCGPQGQVVLVEQKRGPLDETPDGLVKRYAAKTKSVKLQIQRSIDALQQRFKAGHQGGRLVLDYLLYCPDHRVASPATAGIAPERIVDARRPDKLCAILVKTLDSLAGAEGPAPSSVHAFLADELELAVDTGTLVGRARNWVTRLSGGLATWARQLEFEPFRLRVVGTAGSGKTQLALRVMREAAAAGKSVLYVCFNRPLADRIAEIAPPEATVATFHMLGDALLRSRGEIPDFSRPGVFDRLADAFIAHEVAPGEHVDVLVVDEGQDFAQSWADALLRRVKEGGRAWWLEDPMQNLYDRPEVNLPGWVRLRADTNYRTPRDILDQIGRIAGGRRTESGSPVASSGIEFATYRDFESLADATAAAIEQARRAGFSDDDIVVLTYPGRERSALMRFDSLRGLRLRRYAGTYDAAGRPEIDDGDVLIETMFRFKGHSAPCVIFTEIDFDAMDTRVERRLYVGATRATMQLQMVVSERAAQRILERVESAGG